MRLQFNLLPFLAFTDKVPFNFFKEKKDDTYYPLHKSEYPCELWVKHKQDLQKIENLYCNFTTAEPNADYSAIVDLYDSSRFALHYFRHLIRQYFLSFGSIIVSPNFINDIEIWLPAKVQNIPDVTQYYCFTIKIQSARITNKFEMVVSFDGVTRRYNKPISELGDIDPKLLSNVILDNQTYKYTDSESPVNYRFDEAYPIINNTLKKYLELAFENDKPTANKYIRTQQMLQGFCKNYLFTDKFAEIIRLEKKEFYNIPAEKVKSLPEYASKLLFTNYNRKAVEDKNPAYGFKKIGAFKTANIKTNNLKIFFIYQQGTGEEARDFLYNAFLKGAMPDTFVNQQGQTINYTKIKPLYKAIRQQFSTDENGDIVFSNLGNALAEISTQLTAKRIINGNTYLAIYISPISKDNTEDIHFQTVYAGIKELLISKGVTVQGFYENRINEKDSLPFQFTNIYAAILAKIGGIPWQLKTTNQKNLIIGVGAFYSRKQGKKFIGSAFRFDSSGVFHEFACIHEQEREQLILKIRSALKDYVKQNDGNAPQHIIIHFYKELSKADWKPILKMLNDFKSNIPVIVATIFKTETKDIVAFDNEITDRMPLSSTYLQIDTNTFLLYNNSKYNQENWGASNVRKIYHFPIKIKLDSRNSEVLKNEEVVKDTLIQIYQLSRMYWKSVDQQNIPITVKYPEMIAEIVPYFQEENIPNPQFGCKNLWFL